MAHDPNLKVLIPMPRFDPHPAFVGRTEEMENLIASIAKALSGKGHCTILSGEAGIGKSRLIEEVEKKASFAGFSVLRGQCQADGRSPFEGFLDIFRTLGLCQKGIFYGSSTSPFMDGHLARDIRLLEDLVSGRLDQWKPDPYIKGERIKYATLGAVRAISERRPLFIVVEDLQWADTPTIELLQMLARNCVDVRVFLLGSYRTEEREKSAGASTWNDLVDRMTNNGFACEIQLNRFSPDDIDSLVPSLLGNDIDRQVYKLIEAGSEGNPLLIIELTKNLIESGVILEADDYWMVEPSRKAEFLPTSLDCLMLNRLQKLNWMEGRILEVASLIGTEIDKDLLADVIGSNVDEIGEVLEEIAFKTNLLVTTLHGFQFRHDKVRELLSRRIPAELRKELHLALAESLENRSSDLNRNVDLAWHYGHTDRDDKCIEFSLASADAMLDSYALDEALALYKTVLDKANCSLGPIDQIRRACEGAGISLEEKGEYDKAAEMFDRYLETCPNSKDRTRVILRLIECWEPNRLGLGCLEPEKALMDFLQEIGSVEGLDRAKMNDLLANMDNWERKFDDVVRHRKQAGSIYLEYGQMEKYALSLSFSVYALLSLGKMDEAIRNVDAALSIFEEHPYNYGKMDAEMRSAEILMHLGEDQESLIHYGKSALIAGEIGERSMEYLIRCYISMQQLEVGDEEGARASLKRAEQVARLAPSRFSMGAPLAFQAHLEALSGHPERAIGLAEAALHVLEDYKFPRPQRAMALMGYAMALGRQGEMNQAFQRFEEALSEIRGCPISQLYEARAHWWMANCMLEIGNNAEAKTMLEKARPLFEKVNNERMKMMIDSFLDKIELEESMRVKSSSQMIMRR